ncbi:uracil-DNA glycosylase [Ramlibacter sp. G-1-2-2]|uniref:Type-4 uracil-DNA glycosylase n=1 Tax=Ramlibacter agri TaxID=2728837 RepID=A0A848H221_9BURK|nr:uracil-DNA glycosylase [Ramlibacter agri]NML42773.1 uracil-DNA glycosylase [Ramlibacter agri]
MSLDLDERQRAMLAEMGVRVFWPAAREEEAILEALPADEPVVARAAPAPAPAPAPVAAPPVARPVAPPVVAAPVVARAEGRLRIPGIEVMEWDALQQAVASCEACKLCEGRRNTVFGVGDQQADWLVVGEAPGENEDLQGEPFVGQAGKLLDNMLAALGLNRRERVYIANVLKCRPPGNRNPEPEEVAQCEPFLRRQVELLQPKIILAMGRFAVQTLLQTNEPIGRLRGRVHQYNGVPVVVTYHPAYLLRNLPDKAKAWADLCLAQAVLRERS